MARPTMTMTAPASATRRDFLATLGSATTAAMTGVGVTLHSGVAPAAADAAVPATTAGAGDRIAQAYAVRIHAADRMAAVPYRCLTRSTTATRPTCRSTRRTIRRPCPTMGSATSTPTPTVSCSMRSRRVPTRISRPSPSAQAKGPSRTHRRGSRSIVKVSIRSSSPSRRLPPSPAPRRRGRWSSSTGCRSCAT